MGKNQGSGFKIVVGLLVVLDFGIWFLISASADGKNLEMDFLDIGQGDGALVQLPGGVKVLIDAGPPNGRISANLEKILPLNDRYLDLVEATHPQLDHYGGLIEVLKHYDVGAVLTDGQTATNPYWQELEKIIKEKKIPQIVLYAGDKIKYRDSGFDILNPKIGEWAKDLNDLGVVMFLRSQGLKAFFGADISAAKERQLARNFDLDADVLKVSHHGSKFSSDPEFLKAVSSLISVIEVGQNSYGHPTKEALARLAAAGTRIYRTDKNGLVKIIFDNNKIKIYTAH